MRLIPLLALTLALKLGAAEAVQDFRFKAETILENLSQPMQMQFAPDGRLFFIEVTGRLKIYHPNTKTVVEAGKLEVDTTLENGLLGIALDPQFPANGWIYLFHSPKDFSGQTISRFTMKGETLDMASRKDLLKWEDERKECAHRAGGLQFGPDGCLYASTGDNTNPFGDTDGFAPLDTRKPPSDAQRSASNTNDLRGKILRIKPKPDGTYEIPTGNLFPPGTEKTRPEIYAMGFRNPWRFTIDPQTSFLYVGDVGPDANHDKQDRGPRGFDTINQIRKPGNYGWPYSRGNQAYNAFDFTTKNSGAKLDPVKPLNDSPHNTGLRELPPIQPPLIWYPYGESSEFPLLGSGGRTACGGPVFHFDPKFRETDGFPDAFDQSLLIYDWQRPFISWARLDKTGKLVGLEDFTKAVRLAQGESDGSDRLQIKRPSDMIFGPDGSLYILDYGETWGANKDARMVRISYQRGNLPPIAKATVKNGQGREPLTIELSANGSSDPEGDKVKYEWRLQPGDKIIASEADTQFTINEPGEYRAELRITDPQGATGTNSVSVMVGNSAPTLEFISPKDGDFFTPGQPVKYKLRVRDHEDGDSDNKPEELGVRTLVSASAKVAGDKKETTGPGMGLLKSLDCFNCHAVNQKLVGPSFLEIANKYRGQNDAMQTAVQRVIKGSSGVWGPIGMLPHPQHIEDEVHLMVRWIFNLQPDAALPSVARGVEGEIPTPANASDGCVIEATYTDAGRAPVGALSTKAKISLRVR